MAGERGSVDGTQAAVEAGIGAAGLLPEEMEVALVGGAVGVSVAVDVVVRVAE